MKDLVDYQYNDKVITLADLIGLFLAYGDDKIYFEIEDRLENTIYSIVRIISIPSDLYEKRVIGLNDCCRAFLLVRLDYEI